MRCKSLRSNIMRNISAESDALHLGMGWSFDDLNKPQVIIESSYGESHPGSSHLLNLSSFIRDGVIEKGGKPSTFIVTDMCDGVAQGSNGMKYSLLSRDFMANMIEIQVVSSLCDGLILVSSCDKSVPAHLIAAARLNLPTILVPGGCMMSGAGFLGTDQMWELRRMMQNNEISLEEYMGYAAGACPSAGACQMMGTASSMQVITESLGLALTGSALIPTSITEINRAAKMAGNRILELIKHGIKTSDILCRESLENAITVHAAVGGSTNSVVHLLALASEMGIKLNVDIFDYINRQTPYLTNVLSTGIYPTELFWYAGGVPAIMNEIRDLLHLDVLTVSGKTLEENLDNWFNSGHLYQQNKYLKNYRVDPSEIIRSSSQPIAKEGGIAVLRGNIAPLGALVKHAAVAKEMKYHTGPAKVFIKEDDAIKALKEHNVNKGDIIVITYQGPKACGMPEMFRISDVIASDSELSRNTAVITDGRFSGCTRGPAIGYVSPEAVDGGPIALVKDGDIIEIDIPKRKVNLIKGKDEDGKVYCGDELLKRRLKNWVPLDYSSSKGVLGIYKKLVQPSLCGARIN